jgi:hypothetical protein
VLERFAIEELHHDETLPVVLVDFVNRADVRVIQSRCGLHFPPEPFKSGQVVGHPARQEFQPDWAMQPRGLSFVDDAHPAATELFDDAVVANRAADYGRGIRHFA